MISRCGENDWQSVLGTVDSAWFQWELTEAGRDLALEHLVNLGLLESFTLLPRQPTERLGPLLQRWNLQRDITGSSFLGNDAREVDRTLATGNTKPYLGAAAIRFAILLLKVNSQIANIGTLALRRRNPRRIMIDLVEWAGNRSIVSRLSDFHIDRRGLQTSMSKQFLNPADVATILETVRRETMA